MVTSTEDIKMQRELKRSDENNNRQLMALEDIADALEAIRVTLVGISATLVQKNK